MAILLNGKDVVGQRYCEDCNYFHLKVKEPYGSKPGVFNVTCEFERICERLQKGIKANDPE